MIVPFYPDRVQTPIYFASDYEYQVEKLVYKGGSRIILGKIFRDGKLYSQFFRLEYNGVRLNEEANLAGCMIGRHINAWIEFESDQKRSGVFEIDRDLFTQKYSFEIWSYLEGGHSERTRYSIDKQLIIQSKNFGYFLQQGIEKIKSIRFSYFFEHNGWKIWDNNYSNTEFSTNREEGFVRKSNYCVHLKPTVLRQAKDLCNVVENKVFNIGPKKGYRVNWIYTTELSGNMVFFHKAVLPPGTCQGSHIHEGSEEVCYALSGKAIVQLKAELAEDLEGDTVLLKRGKKSGDENSLEEDTLVKEVPFNKGDTLLVQHGGIHGIRNIGNTDFEFISFLHQY